MIRCCNCDRQYELVLKQGGLALPVVECPYCGYRHTVEFKAVEDESPVSPLFEIRLTTAKPVYIANRFLGPTRTALADDNTNVTGYYKENNFIVVFQIDEEKGPWNAQYTLRWRNVTDTGSFAAIASTGEMAWGTSTDLSQGTNVTSKACSASGGLGSTWQNGEEVEGAATSEAINLADEFYTEIDFAVNPAAAHDGDVYAFELYDQTNASSIGTGTGTITVIPTPLTGNGFVTVAPN